MAAGALGALNILLGLDTRTFTQALTKAGYQSENFSRNFQRQMRGMQRGAAELTRNIQALRSSTLGLAAGFAGAWGASEIIKAADSYGQMASRLRAATKDAAEFNRIQEQLYETSNKTYKSFDDAAELFIRIRGALQQLGVDAKKTADFVSTIQYGLTLDSADAQKTQSVINALSKSLLQGKLSADALNTVIAASPTLFQALADSIAGGSQQALRQMVTDGKVTADQLIRVTEQMDELGKRTEGMATSVGDAFTKMRNNIQRYIGDTDTATGATGKMVQVIDYLSDHISELATILGGIAAFKGVGALTRGITGVVAPAVKAIRMAREQREKIQQNLVQAQQARQLAAEELRVAASEEARTAATKRLTMATKELDAAQKVAEASSGRLRKASTWMRAGTALFGGIPGLITTGVTLAAGALITYSQNAKEAERANQRLAQSTDEYAKSLANMTQLQLRAELNSIEKQRKELRDQMGSRNLISTDAWDNITEFRGFDTQNALKGLRAVVREVQDAGDGFDTLSQKVQAYIDKQRENGASESTIKALENVGARIERAAQKDEKLAQSQEQVREQMNQTTDSINSQAAAFRQASPEAEKYLKGIQDRIATMGMNLSQKYAFEVDAKGGSEAQVKQARYLGAIEDKAKDLTDAVRDGNRQQVEAVKQSIIALVEQQNQIRKNALEAEAAKLSYERAANAALAMTQARASGASASVIQSIVADSLLAGETLENTLNERRQKLQKQIDSERKMVQTLVKNITTNTTARSLRAGRAGGGRSASTRAAREQESELQRLTKTLQEERDQLGMTRLEQQLYRIDKLKGTAAEKEQARTIAQTISARKEQIETEKRQRQLQRELADFSDEQDFDYITAGIGSQSREFIRKQLDITNEYSRQRRQLEENQLAESTRISDEAYQAQLDSLDAAEQAKLDILAKSHAKKLELDASWVAGAKEAMNNYIDNAIDVNAQFESMFTNAMGGLENAFTDFVLTGKAGWKDMIDSMISDLMRFAVRYAVMAPIFQGLTRILPSIGSPGSTMINTIGLASGGYVRGPGTGTSDSIPAWLSNGEAVLTAREVRMMGGAAGFEAFRRLLAKQGGFNVRTQYPINKGGFPAFANGGIVGKSLVGNKSSDGSDTPSNVNVQIIDQTSGGVSATRANYDIKNQVLNIVLEDVHRNGRVAKAIKGMA